MRRADREIKSFSEIVEVLERCDTIRLGINDEEYPYVVPLSFGYEVKDGQIVIYVHGAREGKKHDLIGRNPCVCVEADICHRFVETGDNVTTEYESLIGFGRAEKANEADTIRGLDLILKHCGFENFPYEPSVASFMTVYRVTLESVTGKRRAVD